MCFCLMLATQPCRSFAPPFACVLLLHIPSPTSPEYPLQPRTSLTLKCLRIHCWCTERVVELQGCSHPASVLMHGASFYATGIETSFLSFYRKMTPDLGGYFYILGSCWAHLVPERTLEGNTNLACVGWRSLNTCWCLSWVG